MRRRLTILAALAAAALAVTAAPAAAAPPTLTLGATTPEYVSAQVRGTIDPADNETGWNFQYSTDPVTEGWIDGPGWLEQFAGAGSGTQVVEKNLHEVPGSCCPTFGVALKPGTNYKLRLKATSVEGEFFSEVGEFTTLPVTASDDRLLRRRHRRRQLHGGRLSPPSTVRSAPTTPSTSAAASSTSPTPPTNRATRDSSSG